MCIYIYIFQFLIVHGGGVKFSELEMSWDVRSLPSWSSSESNSGCAHVLFLVEVEQHEKRPKQCKNPFKIMLYKALAS